jgi:cell division protein FtsZ
MTLKMPGQEAAQDRPVNSPETPQKEKQVHAAAHPPKEPHVKLPEAEPARKVTPLVLFTQEEPRNSTVENQVEKKKKEETTEWILSQQFIEKNPQDITARPAEPNSPVTAVSGGYLARPSNIYDEEHKSEKEILPEHAPVKDLILNTLAVNPLKEEENSSDMQLVFKDDIPAADVPGAHQTHPLIIPDNHAEEPAMQDEAEDLRRRAADRINKLRNLSFNINAADPNNEFETVPAYIRRNLELYNTISNVESFYSSYEVKTDEQNNSQISTINTFLEGKKPD